MDWLIIVIVLLSFFAGFFSRGIFRKNKDDGMLLINEERVEVIFRDPYENLVKKRYVILKIKS